MNTPHLPSLNASSAPPVRLLEQVRSRLRTLRCRLRTEEAYLQWIKCFVLFHGTRHPREMGKLEIEAFFEFVGGGAERGG